MEVQKVAIIVPTYERMPSLERCLNALARSIEVFKKEAVIIVVDDGTEGGCADVARAADIYVWQQDKGYRLATARNVGARIAMNMGVDILLFLDGDLFVDASWLSKMVKEANRSRSVVFGTINGQDPEIDKLEDQERVWLAARGGNMAVSASMWMRVGEFDERYNGRWGVEDTDWTYRAVEHHGATIRIADADVRHETHETREDWKSEQAANWRIFKEKFGTIGRKPASVRTDTAREMLSLDDVLSKTWLVTATRNRPDDVASWKRERMKWGLPMSVADDGEIDISHVLRKAKKGFKFALTVTGGVGVSAATRLAIEAAKARGAEYIIELDDHDTLQDDVVDVRRICEALREADYVYGNHVRMYEDGRDNHVRSPEHEPDMLLKTGMRWQGFKAYAIAAYDEVGGYRDAEFPAGDFGLALRFENGGKKMVLIDDVWTLCPVLQDALTPSNKEEVQRKVLEYQEAISTCHGGRHLADQKSPQ